MASFTYWEGRERKSVSMGGARANESHREKMQRLRREREDRELQRKQVDACKVVQSWVRGCAARRRQREMITERLDVMLQGAPTTAEVFAAACGLFALLSGPRREGYLQQLYHAAIAGGQGGFAAQHTAVGTPLDLYLHRALKLARAAVDFAFRPVEIIAAAADPLPFEAAGRHDLFATLQDGLIAMGCVPAVAGSPDAGSPALYQLLVARRPEHPTGGFTAKGLEEYVVHVLAKSLGGTAKGLGVSGALFGFAVAKVGDEELLARMKAVVPECSGVAEGILTALNAFLPEVLPQGKVQAPNATPLLPLLALLGTLVGRVSVGWLNRHANGLVVLQPRFGIGVLAAARAGGRLSEVVTFYSRVLQRTSEIDARIAVLSVVAFSEGFIPALYADVGARGVLSVGSIGDPIAVPDRECPGDGVDTLFLFLVSVAHFLDCSHIDELMSIVDVPGTTRAVLRLAVRSIFHTCDAPLCEAVLHLARKLNDWNARREFLPPKDWIIDYPWPTQVTLKDWRAKAVGSPVFRTFTVLQNIPFIIPFETRVLMFRNFVDEELEDTVLSRMHWTTSHTVRRGHIFEDGFRAIYRMSPMELRVKARVTFIDRNGDEEAGFGDGVFKEFLSELVKVVFDPSHALFLQTDANELYPNPWSCEPHVYGMDAFDRYRFIGRVIGKALYEGILIPLPLARFFRNLLLERSNCLHDLPSLDAELHRNLVQLKTMRREDVDDLGLVFAVDVDKLGVQETIEFFPGGGDMPVTAENRMKYIHLTAHMKLTKMIQRQAAAVREGMQDVLSPSWLKMFDSNEIQTLLSGYRGSADLDIDDWEANSTYGGGYTADDHTIKLFWQAVRELTPDEQRRLLKFVTSVDRAPLLGFRYLHPKFCIHKGGEGLPSASTCMCLLKLPTYANKALMREKLIWAISHDTGFGLS